MEFHQIVDQHLVFSFIEILSLREGSRPALVAVVVVVVVVAVAAVVSAIVVVVVVAVEVVVYLNSDEFVLIIARLLPNYGDHVRVDMTPSSLCLCTGPQKIYLNEVSANASGRRATRERST